jgi:hypothetical protein
MFARADQLRIEQIEDEFKLHAVEYFWEGFEPHLTVFNLDDGQLSPLDLEDLNFSVSKKRICVGSWDGDDKYLPCPSGVPVIRFAQCAQCAEFAGPFPIQECVFEPKCEGDQCDSPLCKREHSVYIAFFGNKPKVGMTLKSRIKKRLIEQGADAYCEVATFPSRKGARDQEKIIGQTLKITERPAVRTVLESLSLPKKKNQIEDGWKWISDSLEAGMEMTPGKLEFLDSYPLEEPLSEAPRYVESWGFHSGDFVGIKGKFLIFRKNHLSALKLSDLPSRFLSRD